MKWINTEPGVLSIENSIVRVVYNIGGIGKFYLFRGDTSAGLMYNTLAMAKLDGEIMHNELIEMGIIPADETTPSKSS